MISSAQYSNMIDDNEIDTSYDMVRDFLHAILSLKICENTFKHTLAYRWYVSSCHIYILITYIFSSRHWWKIEELEHSLINYWHFSFECPSVKCIPHIIRDKEKYAKYTDYPHLNLSLLIKSDYRWCQNDNLKKV